MLAFSLRCWDQQIVTTRTDTHASRKIHYTSFAPAHASICHTRWELEKNYLHVLQRHVLLTTALSQHYCNWDMMDSFTAVWGHINRLSPYKEANFCRLHNTHQPADLPTPGICLNLIHMTGFLSMREVITVTDLHQRQWKKHNKKLAASWEKP